MPLLPRLLIVTAALMGAAGVTLAALAAHGADAGRLTPASSMLLIHAPALLAALLLAERGLVAATLGRLAAFALGLGAVLFATDLTLRHFAGHALFPMAAPTGGTVMILGWLALGVAALARGPRIG